MPMLTVALTDDEVMNLVKALAPAAQSNHSVYTLHKELQKLVAVMPPAPAPATITYRGRQYRVEVGDEPDKDFRPRYALHGSRGATYWLVRHRERPALMYPVDGRMKILPGWFRDDGPTGLREYD
jgi:hypothetical protein